MTIDFILDAEIEHFEDKSKSIDSNVKFTPAEMAAYLRALKAKVNKLQFTRN